ncbi:TPA: hypothetical protein N0F65_007207 [Lagenidium giganteum]|uniref:Uncharacterized protein n=1 Tax=Lagenidium giganteum TaxID=4803 RepID=A0AAV2ZB07_9STRA|nr:TPA: hypothetical protein N0F65_007207 [Lagenidium giganteum]
MARAAMTTSVGWRRALALLLLLVAMLCVHAQAHEDHAKTEETAVAEASSVDPPAFVRCRMCGGKVALKADYMEMHDTSKAIASKREAVLGANGELHTFINPSRVEMELAAFKKTVGIEGETYTKKATFFEGYNWRDLRCSSCKRHLGWAFHHDHYQQCLNDGVADAMAAKATEALNAIAKATESRQEREEIVRKAMDGKCVTTPTGWWTYEVCYKQEVRQYHEQSDGTRPSDWSMGVYVPTDQIKTDSMTTAELAEMANNVVQFFEGGQHCDENGAKRSTRVTYTCCDSNPSTVMVEDIDEPQLCTYRIRVCIPGLCKAKAKANDVDQAAIAKQCAADFTATHQEATTPATFSALRWSTVISDDSSELDWVRDMDFQARA